MCLRADVGRWVVVIALLSLAAVVRASVMMYEFLSGDDASVALMGKHILTGENFPVFMYRISYMGSLNGVHLVPALFLFGFSPLVVRVNAIMYSLLFPLGLYVLGRRLFDDTAARVTLLLAAVPPFLLSYWSTVAEQHLEANTFGVVLLLLAVAAMRADNAARYSRALLCLGLTAGVALWTSVKAIEVLLPVLLVLWIRNPWLPLSRVGVVSAGAFIIGSSPAWLFYLLRGDPAQGQVGSTEKFFALDMSFSVARAMEVATTALPTVLGTYYWPVDTIAREAALGVNGAIYAVGTVVVAAGMVREAIRCGIRAVRPSGHLLLLLALATPLAMLYAYRVASPLDEESARYILPVYIPLFLFVGALVARLWRRWRFAGVSLVAFLILFNLWTNLSFMWPLDAAERARRAKHVADRQAFARLLDTERIEALYTNHWPTSVQFAFVLENPVVSTLVHEIYPPHAIRADAAERVAILTRGTAHAIERSLEAAGIYFQVRPTPFGQLYTDFELEAPRGYREIPATRWRASAFPHPEFALYALDRDAGTRWESREPRREGMWFQVDLGEVHQVAKVTWLPGGSDDIPTGFRLEASRDGAQWTVLREVPAYSGPVFWSGGRPIARVRWARVELRFRPVEARYLRVTHLGGASRLWWTIREFFVYEDGGPMSHGSVDTGLLVQSLLEKGVRKIYADHALSARVAYLSGGHLTVPPSNTFLDAHGWMPELDRLPGFEPGPGVAVVYRSSSEVGEFLRKDLGASGWTFTTDEIGGYQVLSEFWRRPVPGSPFTAPRWEIKFGSAVESGSAVASDVLIDGRLDTRWTTSGPQEPGSWLQVSLASPEWLSGVVLDLGPFDHDYPRRLALEVFSDGSGWHPIQAAFTWIGPLRWAGTHVLRDGVRRVVLTFEPSHARKLRLRQTGRDPIFHWSVAELQLLRP